MKTTEAIVTGLAVLCVAGAAYAQTTPQTERVKGEAKVETVKMTGTVVEVRDNYLLAKMQPLGNLSLFKVMPGREFIIDGQKKLIGDLKPGTELTGMITTRTTPVTVRTTSTLNGTVWHAQDKYVILTLPDGEIRIQRARVVPVHRRGQTRYCSRAEARDEGHRHEDHRRAGDRDVDRYRHHRQIAKVERSADVAALAMPGNRP